ncbi:MAG: D-glycero-beta-D-manno-heptose 1-phosphate adenylyltransferase [Chitinophagaceae bacterium]|nr:D-glycero-beta-D-manno-heptose 1-phosphate adenylyltransferase [Chitinophagaceae bacterium]
MKAPDFILQKKIVSAEEAARAVYRHRFMKKKIAFTNGVFDMLHAGHLHLLENAAAQADILVVGLNSDTSVKRLKGEQRPIMNQENRAKLLASLLFVDMVVIFEEDTPLQLIQMLMPDVLIKGGDYQPEQVVGAKEVAEQGGQVVIVPLLEGYSTTALIQKIQTET